MPRSSSSVRTLSCALLVASYAIALVSGEARADEQVIEPSVPRAEEHVSRGLELRKEDRDLDALAEFQLAYGIRPTSRVRAQIALAEQALGRWVVAESD